MGGRSSLSSNGCVRPVTHWWREAPPHLPKWFFIWQTSRTSRVAWSSVDCVTGPRSVSVSERSLS
eukprot:1334023-Lingulodinium_polyedra.AAC.1